VAVERGVPNQSGFVVKLEQEVLIYQIRSVALRKSYWRVSDSGS